jgi:hypothetical protein
MKRSTVGLASLILIVVVGFGGRALGEVKPAAAGGGFRVEMELVLPATPNEVFDAATGDISAWWDHSFSGHPKKLFIEPKPGGGFYEIFDDAGNGVLHATVIYAQRGKMLRFVGPLGLSGRAVDCVTTWEFNVEPAAAGGTASPGTKLKLTVAISGEVDEATAKIVDAVWHHFLVERLKPYIESGEYKKKSASLEVPVPKDFGRNESGPSAFEGEESLENAQGVTGIGAASGKIGDFSFLSGRWTGMAGAETTEQVCTVASHHLILCTFRRMDAENTTGVELVTLREIPIAIGGPPVRRGAVDDTGNAVKDRVLTTVEERVRFFEADLAEKAGDDGITLRLASVSPTEIVFDNAKTDGVVKHVRIIRVGNDEFKSHIDLVGPDGKTGVIEATWKRAR